MKRARPGFKWTHEDASQMMLQDLIDKNGIDSLSTDDVALIKSLISGDMPAHRSYDKKFLFDIVANKRNGIDVDKMDYIDRVYLYFLLLLFSFL